MKRYIGNFASWSGFTTSAIAVFIVLLLPVDGFSQGFNRKQREKQLAVLKEERHLLDGALRRDHRTMKEIQVSEIRGDKPWDDSVYPRDERLKMLRRNIQRLQNRLRGIDDKIRNFEIDLELVRLKERLAEKLPLELYIRSGADFYPKLRAPGCCPPEIRPARYARVMEGMKLTLHPSGKWKLEYDMIVDVEKGVFAEWHLVIRDPKTGAILVQVHTPPRELKQSSTLVHDCVEGTLDIIRLQFHRLSDTVVLSRVGSRITPIPQEEPTPSSPPDSQQSEAAPAGGEAAPTGGEAAPTGGEAAPAEGEPEPAEGEPEPTGGETAPEEN